MRTITAIELARNLGKILDRLAMEGEELIIERHHRQVARLVPVSERVTAIEAMSDFYRTLPKDAAAIWEGDLQASDFEGGGCPKGSAIHGILNRSLADSRQGIKRPDHKTGISA